MTIRTPSLCVIALALANLGQAPAPKLGTITGRVNTLDGGKPIKVPVWVYLKPQSRVSTSLGKSVVHKIVQSGKLFRAPVAVIPLGATVTFPNLDKFEHSVFSPAVGSWLGFELGRYRTDTVGRSYEFLEPGEFDIYCDIHPNMSAKVKVVPTRHVAQVIDGAYRFDDIPPGSYTVVAWTPNSKESAEKVEVAAGATVKVFDINLQYKKGPSMHLTSTGTPYPPTGYKGSPRP